MTAWEDKLKHLISPTESKWPYRVVQIKPNRANDEEIYTLSGREEDIAANGSLFLALYDLFQRNVARNSTDSDIIRYSGIPEVILEFKGIDKSLPAGRQTVRGAKSFRFTGYTDNPVVAQRRQDLELITQADIKRLGEKIRILFKTTPYIWSKGKDQVIYHDWERGYNLNVYALNHNEGERLVKQILLIRDFQIDETFLKYSEAKNTAKAYPATTKIQVLGQTKEIPERLPKSNVRFQVGKIYLPTLKQTLVIA
jgi:hypothetical protein